MMKLTAPAIAICIASVFHVPAHAIDMRSASIEWWTNISDIVVFAEVSATEKVAPVTNHWQSQRVACTKMATLKGERQDSLTFLQECWEPEHGTGTDDVLLGAKTKLLLFCVHDAGRHKTEIIFWVNVTKPDVSQSDHAPYNNDCKWLGDGEAVLTLVNQRIAKEKPGAKKKRGVIVDFTVYEERECYWDFVRTADPEYKQVLIKQLREGDKESAIYNLVSYPGKDTVALILPFLKDPATRKAEFVEGEYVTEKAIWKTVKIYPLRQAAYSALQLLGESPKKPEGFYPDWFAVDWRFAAGFEHRDYFPHGDWKRFEPELKKVTDYKK